MSSNARTVWAVLATAIVCGAIPAAAWAAAPPAAETAEVLWAKGVADDFLQAVISADWQNPPSAAIGLLSADYAAAVREDKSWHFFAIVPHGKYQNPRYTTAELAPDESEVRLTGTVTNPDGKVATFTLRIAKEAVGGKWAIRYMRIKEPGQ